MVTWSTVTWSTVTSLLRPPPLFFGLMAKRPYIFPVKNGQFFWPIGDSINGVPLYVTIEVLCGKGGLQRILKLSFVLSGLSFPYVSFRN